MCDVFISNIICKHMKEILFLRDVSIYMIFHDTDHKFLKLKLMQLITKSHWNESAGIYNV